MHGCASLLKRALFVALLLVSALAQADITFRQAKVQLGDEGYLLSARFACSLPPALEDALQQGMTLGFALDFELIRHRRLWFDSTVVTLQRSYKLSYSALTRQYRLSYGGLYRGYPRLDSALGALCTPSGWQVLEKGGLRELGDLQGRIRLQLDSQQLPQTFQIKTLTSPDWNLGSDWQSFSFTPEAAP